MSTTLKHFSGLKKLLGSVWTPGSHSTTGTVRWFDARRGYGFIELEDRSGDVFVHRSEVEKAGFRRLRKGQEVAFDVVPDEKGPKAVNVMSVGKE